MLNKYLVTCTYLAPGMEYEGNVTYQISDLSVVDAICQALDRIETEAWNPTFISMKISAERIGDPVTSTADLPKELGIPYDIANPTTR